MTGMSVTSVDAGHHWASRATCSCCSVVKLQCTDYQRYSPLGWREREGGRERVGILMGNRQNAM